MNNTGLMEGKCPLERHPLKIEGWMGLKVDTGIKCSI